jgi:hypothetical protein
MNWFDENTPLIILEKNNFINIKKISDLYDQNGSNGDQNGSNGDQNGSNGDQNGSNGDQNGSNGDQKNIKLWGDNGWVGLTK